MNFKYIIFILIFISLFLETSLISFPLVLTLSLLCYMLYPQVSTVVFVFFAGLILDSLNLAPIGTTSFAILISFSVVEAIKSTFTLSDYRLIILVLFAGSYVYALLFQYNANILIYVALYLILGIIAYQLSKNKLLW